MTVDLDDFVRLEQVSEAFFHIAPVSARRKAAAGTLPVPSFRFGARGPLYVRKSDLERYMQDVIRRGESLHAKMKAAGAV